MQYQNTPNDSKSKRVINSPLNTSFKQNLEALSQNQPIEFPSPLPNHGTSAQSQDKSFDSPSISNSEAVRRFVQLPTWTEKNIRTLKQIRECYESVEVELNQYLKREKHFLHLSPNSQAMLVASEFRDFGPSDNLARYFTKHPPSSMPPMYSTAISLSSSWSKRSIKKNHTYVTTPISNMVRSTFIRPAIGATLSVSTGVGLIMAGIGPNNPLILATASAAVTAFTLFLTRVPKMLVSIAAQLKLRKMLFQVLHDQKFRNGWYETLVEADLDFVKYDLGDRKK